MGFEPTPLVSRIIRSCTPALCEATRNERSFEEESRRTARKREWTAKHPLPCWRDSVAGEGDQFTCVSIEQHGGGGFLPSPKIPHPLPHPQ